MSDIHSGSNQNFASGDILTGEPDCQREESFIMSTTTEF